MRKVYYIYNPQTQTYDRIYPTVRQRALSILRRLFIGMGLGAGSFIVLLLIFGSPSEKELRKDFEDEMAAAIADAGADFDEGDVGAGRGTMCMGLKGGIGSASRIVTVGGQHFTLGALVQTNFGRLDDLLVAGYPAGAAIRRIVSAPPAPEDKGSCMIIIGTDLPVSHRQLSRILRRAAVGLVRTGSFVEHDDLRQVTLLREEALDGAFRAAAESVEEAILNSLCTADRVTAAGMGAAGNETVTLAGFSEFLPALLPALRGRG